MEETTEKTKPPGESVVEVPLMTEALGGKESLNKDKETPKEKEALEEKEASKKLDGAPKKSWKTPILLCLLWFLATICNTFLVKAFEIATRVGMMATIVVVQLVSISLYSCLFNIIWDVPKNKTKVSWKTYAKLILPLVVCILFRVGYNTEKIWPTPISDPDSLSAEAFFVLWMLFLTIIHDKFLPKEDKSDHRSAIIVAVLGCALLVGKYLNPYEGRTTGKVILYATTAAFELVYSKKTMTDTGIHPTKLLAIISGLVFVGYSPIWILQLKSVNNAWRYSWSMLEFKWVVGVFAYGALSWVQTLAAFTLISELTVRHYLIGSACNRIIRILAFILITTFFRVGLWPEDFEGWH